MTLHRLLLLLALASPAAFAADDGWPQARPSDSAFAPAPLPMACS